MVEISNYGLIAQLRADASQHVILYRNGAIKRSGRGLVFWFRPETASIALLPADEREMTLFVKGRSQDFQPVSLQGTLTFRIADPDRAAERVDFSIGLRSGAYHGEPIQRLETRLTGLVNQGALQFLAERPVRALLDAGVEPLRRKLEADLATDTALAELGIAVSAVRLANIAPSSELERALQTPIFEALQQKADEAMFERRALAVDKERAIAENELANKIELARRERDLIEKESGNARDRAMGLAEAQNVEADAEAKRIGLVETAKTDAEANRIRLVETARADAERAQMEIYRDLPPAVVLALAARQLAEKLTTIEHVNVTPDMLSSIMREFRGMTRPAIEG